MSDDRSDIEKALAYEAQFARDALLRADEHLTEMRKELSNVKKWHDTMCATMDEIIKGRK